MAGRCQKGKCGTVEREWTADDYFRLVSPTFSKAEKPGSRVYYVPVP